MNMKLSYRDKVIFIVAIVVIILVAGFFLLIKPKFEEIDVAQANYDSKVAEREAVDAKIGTLPAIVENLKAAAQAVGDEQGIFLEEMAPYENETYIRELLESQRVEVRNMNTAYTFAGNIARYAVSEANILAYENKINTDLYNELPQEVYDAYNGVPAPTYPSAIIGVTTMNCTYASDDINTDYRIIDRLASDEKTIILNTISNSTENDEAGDERTTAINLTMYSIFPLNVEQVLQESDEVVIPQ